MPDTPVGRVSSSLPDIPVQRASAPGKIILCGEHAVVYGRPAIAMPVRQVQAHARIVPVHRGAGCTIIAHDLNETIALRSAPADHPLAAMVRLTLTHLRRPIDPDWTIHVHSTIPIARGLGSGAAVSVALIRAVATQLGCRLSAAEIASLAYEGERLHHGHPSGIDSTVIAYDAPIWFVRACSPEALHVGAPLHFVIADSGMRNPTRAVVMDVRRAWETDPAHYEARFDAIAEVVRGCRAALSIGDSRILGALINRNHVLLVELGVSSAELERLVQAARAAGALGAKLSGAGRGGNVVALVESDKSTRVEAALRAAGAVAALRTEVI